MKKIYLGRDKRFCGVCDGFAKYFGIDPVLVRIVTVCIALFTAIIPTTVVYLIMALVLPDAPEGYTEVVGSYKRITRGQDKKLCGVCSGIASYFNLDATIVRLIFALLALWLGGGVLVYLVCAVMLPPFDPYDQV